ncbi:MAG: MMPL family transporter [Paludibacteraceae bacterium]|nr:MMPL family transporter [Paludibacteraceae bacterium]
MTRKRTHYILFYSTVFLALVCGVLMFYTNVNSDMTKYLPHDSEMSQGLVILNDEFGSIPSTSGDVHAMFEDLNDTERLLIADSLDQISDVDSVRYKVSADGKYTLYDMDVDKSVNQKQLGQNIAKRFGHNAVVETSQDGATPPLSVIIIAAVLILVILIVMAQSWVESFIILFTSGVAILLNTGTNALLPSVSITTNYIGSILQMVLSLDYCIVLLNRYRQEQRDETDKRDAVLAANKSIRRAFRPIMSSALTTIIGLLMLCFMRLRIGLDMGIVLAKGVVCSLICTFTVLPSMMMLMRNSINSTVKKAPVLPTDRLGRFATSHKIPLAIFAVCLFGFAYYFAGKTEIFFCTNGESEIEKVFPQPNPVVILYNNDDQEHIIPLADSLKHIDGVETIISYPTLLQQRYTSDEMVRYIQNMTTQYSDLMPDTVPLDMLTPRLMQTLYYMHSHRDTAVVMTFPEMIQFIETQCLNDPMTRDFIDDDMRKQLALLHTLERTNPAEEEEEERIVVPKKPKKKYHTSKDILPVQTDSTQSGGMTHSEYILLTDFLPRLYEAAPSEQTAELSRLSNRHQLNRQMTKRELSDFVGSSMAQTKMVFKFAKGKHETMSPLQYVHTLTDDLFQRKLLRAMVSDDQVEALTLRVQLMDLCNQNVAMSPRELSELLAEFGITGLSSDALYSIAYPESRKQETLVAATQTDSLSQDSLSATIETAEVEKPKPVVKPKVTKPVIAKKKTHRKTAAEIQQDRATERILDLLEAKQSFRAEEMAAQFAYLGQQIPAEQVSLLYTFYGSINDSTAREIELTPEILINYLSDTLANDPRLQLFISVEQRADIESIKPKLLSQMSQLNGTNHSLLILLTNLPQESARTFASLDRMHEQVQAQLKGDHYMIGESAMYREMKAGFGSEMTRISLLTIIAIFLIVAISFRSIIVPTILVLTVMTAVYVNVIFAGLLRGEMLYLAYLIVQSILMGATIDYGILFANYYKEHRRTMLPYEAVKAAYKGSIRTITTSGLIMIVGPGAMAILVDDITISAIVGCLAVGAAMAVLLILIVLPGVLVACDKLVVRKSQRLEPKPETPETKTDK